MYISSVTFEERDTKVRLEFGIEITRVTLPIYDPSILMHLLRFDRVDERHLYE